MSLFQKGLSAFVILCDAELAEALLKDVEGFHIDCQYFDSPDSNRDNMTIKRADDSSALFC